ncbi:MAG TPA: hypothetical protein VFB15_02865 [Candidatus Binataceae bacterium]|nr:hypothetical protein [Candidatus Binataceae bacterium]
MGLLKRKEEKSETIALRVPSSLKMELEELRKRADAAGFDLTATITESLARLARQVRSELDEPPVRSAVGGRSGKLNRAPGVAMNDGTAT